MALPAGRYGVTKAQLLKIKKLPMNTIKLLEELIEKYNSLGTAATKNSTTTITSDSTDLPTGGAVYEAIEGQEQLLNDTVGWIGKNLLPVTLENLKANNTGGTWSGNVYTFGGVSFTIEVNNNGNVESIKANGISNNNVDLMLFGKNVTSPNEILFNNTVICSTGIVGSASTYRGVVWGEDGGYIDNVEKTVLANTKIYGMAIRISTNYTANNVIFYPMIRHASITDPTYEPHHASVEETLTTKTDNSVIAPIENGTNASQAYAVGEHFIRNGKFCTVTQAIAIGDLLTEGTNYSVGDVASELNKLRMNLIPNNSNLDNLTLGDLESEKVFYATSSVASTLSNVPFSGSGFRLELKRMLMGAERLIQICYANIAETQDIYYRLKTASGWQTWKHINFTS